MKYKRVLIYTAFLTAVVILVTAQTTKTMEEKSNEKCPQFLYTEKEIDKISANYLSSYLMKEAGLKADIVQIACSRAEDTGRLHMLKAENPRFIIRGMRA